MDTSILTESEIQKHALNYLEKCKKQYGEDMYSKLTIWGVHTKTMKQYIISPDDCGHWKLDYVYKVDRAVLRTTKLLVLSYPSIPKQTQEDKTLAKIITKFSWNLFSSDFFRGVIQVQHVIKYLERNMEIKEWNADFVILLQQTVERVKEHLLSEQKSQ